MLSKPAACLFTLLALRSLNATSASGQTPDTGWEIRPKVTASVELLHRTRVQTWGELQHATNFSFQRWRSGALVSHRMKAILKSHHEDIDQEREHYLVFGAGYEYLDTTQDDKTTTENRIFADITPQVLFEELLLSDRNRAEFRWVNGAYDFRYRNKLMISDRLQVRQFRFTPYVSGELYYDRNHHSWNQSQ